MVVGQASDSYFAQAAVLSAPSGMLREGRCRENNKEKIIKNVLEP